MAFYAPDDSNFVTEVCGDNSAYRFVKVIGKGGFGRVILAVDHSKGNRYVAIKAVNRAQAPESYICREVNNHRKLSTGHDHVIQLYRLFLTPSYFCFVMEYAEGSTLLNFMEKLYEHEKANPDYFVQQREAWAKWFFQQFALAMDYCHRRGVINRDVKLENTLLTHDFDSYLDARRRNLRQWPMVKITDFGLSKSDKDSMPNSGVGTIQYMAPEVITASRQVSPLGAPYNGQLADTWSLGVLLYVLVYHRFPFQPDPSIEPRGAEGFSAVLHKIVNCELALPTHIYRECHDTRVSARVSDECRQLLASLLDANPQRRITLDRVLEHPWTTTCDWVVMANAVQWSKEFCKMDAQLDNSEEEVQMILQQVSPAPRSAVLHPAWLDSVVDRALAADSSSSSRLSEVTGMAGGARATHT